MKTSPTRPRRRGRATQQSQQNGNEDSQENETYNFIAPNVADQDVNKSDSSNPEELEQEAIQASDASEEVTI